jgi:hypothetical protein
MEGIDCRVDCFGIEPDFQAVLIFDMGLFNIEFLSNFWIKFFFKKQKKNKTLKNIVKIYFLKNKTKKKKSNYLSDILLTTLIKLKPASTAYNMAERNPKN